MTKQEFIDYLKVKDDMYMDTHDCTYDDYQKGTAWGAAMTYRRIGKLLKEMNVEFVEKEGK